MRIIAGTAKGMPLRSPRCGVRPTTDRAREAIFSSLGDRVVGVSVLDLFAGTGALGLEAVSRGARRATFVENAAAPLRCLRENIERFRHGWETSCELEIVRADVFTHLRQLAASHQTFSVVFADPPYGEGAQQLLDDEQLPHVIPTAGIFVLESAKRDALRMPAVWNLRREGVYGDTRVSFLEQINVPSPRAT